MTDLEDRVPSVDSDIAILRAATKQLAAEPNIPPSVRALLVTLARIALEDLER